MDELRTAEALAARVDETAWDFARAGRRLVASGYARCGEVSRRDWFAAMASHDPS